MPTGWSGHFDDATGISCTPFGVQAGKSIFLIHPPWRGGTGTTNQTFQLSLPTAKKITLSFAVAMKEGETGPGKSDGATFRVFVDNKKIFEQNQTTAVWLPTSLDLTGWAGKTFILRFESDPGPKDDPSYDYAFWGDRTISVEGAAASGSHIAPIAQKRIDLIKDYRSGAGIAPPFCAAYPEIKFAQQFIPGQVGLLNGWTGKISRTNGEPVRFGLGAGAVLDLVLPNGKIIRSDAKQVALQTAVTRSGDRTICLSKYSVAGRTVTVKTVLSMPAGNYARADVTSEDPYVSAIHPGAIGPVAFRRLVNVPYYGPVSYFPDCGLFANVIIDHQRSHASQLENGISTYSPLTDGKRNRVSETYYYAVSPDLLSVVPTPANPPSPFRHTLSDKIVLDTWGGNYSDNAALLKDFASYGITHLLTIAHVWQNGGYDNMLPDVLPAYAPLGGDSEMKVWTSTATSLGELMSLHENYVDFYPNAHSWNESDVARDSKGQRVTAWLNEGTGIQSFAVAPDAILKYAREITPQVQERFRPNASYLDVHSAVPPWFHVDFRSDHAGAGMFSTVWNAHRDLWKLFRETHKGPVLGEGNNHWYWSGLLDGVEAQFGTGVPGNTGMTAPLLVDFDLATIHPLQLNHGMGYVERWLPGDFDKVWHTRIPSMKTLDQYRMQEVAYGHAGFIASVFQNSLPFIWQEHNLIWPLTARYAEAAVQSIAYERDGRFVGAGAIAAEGGAFDRVRITYANGLTIYANSNAQVWQPDKRHPAVPQYGWIASAPEFEASTALRNDDKGNAIVTDLCRKPDSLFVNARSVWTGPDRPRRVRPSAGDFAQTGPRKFSLRYSWQVGAALPKGYVQFIHLTGAGGTGGEKILMQPGSGIGTQPSEWRVGQVTIGIPVETTFGSDVQDGDYELKTGIYTPTTGERLRLEGVLDETDRVILGVITVSNRGETITFRKSPDEVPENALDAERKEHVNLLGTIVDFGEIRTDGSLQLQKQSDGTVSIIPFPRDGKIQVEIDARKPFGNAGYRSIEALDITGKPIGKVTVKLNNSGSRYQFTLGEIGGAVRYRVGKGN